MYGVTWKKMGVWVQKLKGREEHCMEETLGKIGLKGE
jgi:hypothetical protein